MHKVTSPHRAGNRDHVGTPCPDCGACRPVPAPMNTGNAAATLQTYVIQ